MSGEKRFRFAEEFAIEFDSSLSAWPVEKIAFDLMFNEPNRLSTWQPPYPVSCVHLGKLATDWKWTARGIGSG